MNRKESYSIVPNLDSPELNILDHGVWAMLCRFAQWEKCKGNPFRTKEGTCSPSLRTLAQEGGCSMDTIRRSIKKLQTLGYIVINGRSGKNGEQRSNDYTLFATRQTIRKTEPPEPME